MAGKLHEALKTYFSDTPKERLDEDWKELEYLNESADDTDSSEDEQGIKAWKEYLSLCAKTM